ncbi:MAG: hypothetical protein KBD51_00805 [Candidatus Levybacteria bacterium]|nr:hypothetical protein [Candidatus Levybacteria bacterium]
MYYSHSCSYCTRIFYTFHNSKHEASKALYHGIRKHLVEYNEDHKEFQFDDGEQIDIDEIYIAVTESDDPPSGGYEL